MAGDHPLGAFGDRPSSGELRPGRLANFGSKVELGDEQMPKFALRHRLDRGRPHATADRQPPATIIVVRKLKEKTLSSPPTERRSRQETEYV